MLDCLDDELTTDEIVSREIALDKELIKLIQTAAKENNVPRFLEVSRLLHHTASFDSAVKVAEFYHLVGLKEKLGMIKADREESEDRLIVARNKRRRWMKPDPPLRQIAEPSTASSSRFDPLGDTRPPPVIIRPGMARVSKPIIETTRYSSQAPSTTTYAPSQEQTSWDNPGLGESPPPAESKRKRVEVEAEESFPSSDFSAMPPPPKQSKSCPTSPSIELSPLTLFPPRY